MDNTLLSWNLKRRRRSSLFIFISIALVLHLFVLYLFRPITRSKPLTSQSSPVISIVKKTNTSKYNNLRLKNGLSQLQKSIPFVTSSSKNPAPEISFTPSFDQHEIQLRDLPSLGEIEPQKPSLSSGVSMRFLKTTSPEQSD